MRLLLPPPHAGRRTEQPALCRLEFYAKGVSMNASSFDKYRDWIRDALAAAGIPPHAFTTGELVAAWQEGINWADAAKQFTARFREAEQPYERWLVTTGGMFGHFGSGATRDEAAKNWRKAGGRKTEGNYREQQFRSSLPFAPAGRAATPEEADAFISRDGTTNWVRCQRVSDTEARNKPEQFGRYPGKGGAA
jgi:hypothetical protein